MSKQNSKTFWRVSTPAHASWLPPSTNLNESRICSPCVKLFKPRYPKRLFAQKSHFDNGSSNLWKNGEKFNLPSPIQNTKSYNTSYTSFNLITITCRGLNVFTFGCGGKLIRWPERHIIFYTYKLSFFIVLFLSAKIYHFLMNDKLDIPGFYNLKKKHPRIQEYAEK